MIEFFTCGEFHLRPIRRFAAYTVFSALVIACRLAMCPTRRFPASVTATMLGVVLYPPRLGMTTGVSPSITATQELVVPRSMPMTRSMDAFRDGDSASIGWTRPARPPGCRDMRERRG